jgi:hypothetical protein
MHRIVNHLRGNVVAYLALFIALGGASYAAVSVPANSVGTRQLRNHSVTPVKLDPGKIGASVRYWAVIGPNGNLMAARPSGARIVAWDPNLDTGLLRWPSLTRSCFALSTGSDGFVRAQVLSGPGSHATVQFETYNASGQPTGEQADVAVLCPTP